jgi:drug/metabolite transporter (DMT)-like permease
MGLLSLIFMFIVWSSILSKIDLSVAVPIASFSYILVALVSILFLHETITLLRWIGIFLILTGVIFVSVSSRVKESILT